MQLKWNSELFWQKFRSSPKWAIAGAHPRPKMNLLKVILESGHYFSLILCLKLEVNDAFKMAQ